jgi:3-hydroxyisobutyrate dehydrogenase-like beta-hydroxyacid dehydrogenase
MTTVAMVGLGHMGAPIARNLLKAGHDVRVHNRNPAKAEPLEALGAVACATSAEAARGAAVVVSSLFDDASMLELAQAPEGLVKGMAPGAIHACTTTISPQCSETLAQLHLAAGQRFVAIPVVGRPPAAEAGTLIVLAGGEPAVIDSVEDVLMAFASQVIRAGHAPAAAATMKLAVNFLIVSMIEVLGEVFAFAEKGAIDLRAMEELTRTMLGHPAIAEYLARVAERRFDDAGFEAATGLKDVRLMLDRSRDLDVELPIAELARGRLEAALEQGWAGRDWSVIAEMARREPIR